MNTLKDELREAIQDLQARAVIVEGYADQVRDAAQRLKAAADNAEVRLLHMERPEANDAFADNAREATSMKYELGRLADSLQTMASDCDNYR